MTDQDVHELHEHQERRRQLDVLLAEHKDRASMLRGGGCMECHVVGPCEWVREIKLKRDEYDREVQRIARLVGIHERI